MGGILCGTYELDVSRCTILQVLVQCCDKHEIDVYGLTGHLFSNKKQVRLLAHDSRKVFFARTRLAKPERSNEMLLLCASVTVNQNKPQQQTHHDYIKNNVFTKAMNIVVVL
jgi:hypothetical protein